MSGSGEQPTCLNPPAHITKMFTDRIIQEGERMSSELRSRIKRELINEIVKCYEKDRVTASSSPLKAAEKRLRNVFESLREAGYSVIAADFETSSRVLVGMSEGELKQSLEVGMVMDKVLGIPYIPGPSIKGALRHYLHRVIGDDSECWESAEAVLGPEPGGEALNRPLVFIADAYPVGLNEGTQYLIEPDIVTPHYYKGGKPVESELDVEPTPVPHVSLSEGVVIRFVAGILEYPRGLARKYIKKVWECVSKKEGIDNAIVSSNPLLAFLTMLGITLKYSGIGGRTSKGYGILSILPSGYFEIGEADGDR